MSLYCVTIILHRGQRENRRMRGMGDATDMEYDTEGPGGDAMSEKKTWGRYHVREEDLGEMPCQRRRHEGDAKTPKKILGEIPLAQKGQGINNHTRWYKLLWTLHQCFKGFFYRKEKRSLVHL